MSAFSLDDMALFVEVARAGNFSRACVKLGIPNATLSRRIATLERELGVRLFERSTRRVTMTSAARGWFDRCAPIIDELRVAHEALRGEDAELEGSVKISTPVDFGITYLGEWLPEFCRRNPRVTLDLDLSPRQVDLFAEAVDVAIRLEPPHDERLVVRRIGSIPRGLFAGPAYLERHGVPRTLEDLASHRCLFIGSAAKGVTWRLGPPGAEHRVAVQGQVGLNNMSLTRILAERDLGIALLPVDLARPSLMGGTLAQVLPRVPMGGWPVHVVTTSRQQRAPVRALVEFIERRLKAASA